MRKIIRIDQEKCNGCGECITSCAEGALKLVDGKATLVRDQFCDGFGDCVGACPTGALVIEERPAQDFDYQATRRHVLNERGSEGVRQFEAAGMKHGLAPVAPTAGGCPGTRMRIHSSGSPALTPAGKGLPGQVLRSDLGQWPVQLHLVRPGTEIFRNKELVVLATCAPVASADVHWRFLRGRAVVVACPKLDDTAPYVDKLAAILAEPSIPKVFVVRLEVPCCAGLSQMLHAAVARAGRSDLAPAEVIVGTNGDIHPET